MSSPNPSSLPTPPLLCAALRFPGPRLIEILKDLVPKLLSNPHVRELFRFIFLGTVVELTRTASLKAADFVKHFFVVKASFTRGDFAFDWVKRYLEDHHVWDNSRIFHVAACNPALRHRSNAGLGEDVQSDYAKNFNDGRPHPIYQPAPQEPELFQWRGHWISVRMNVQGGTGFNNDNVQTLTLSVWSRNRKILDEFVLDAREHYFESALPPRELDALPDKSGSLLTARFAQGDASYDWMIAFLRSQATETDVMDLAVSTKRFDLSGPSASCSDKPLVGFKPAPHVKQRMKWRNHWMQFNLDSGASYRGGTYSGAVTVTIHNSKRSVLEDLVLAAREEYLKKTTSKVMVHLAQFGGWTKHVTKKRRALNTLILPEGMKERLLTDMRDFLGSEEWYVWAGVPHRRGYLLYGQPGTGKSSTIHAVAGELGLEIYYIQLASQGMNDANLATLVASTPSRCILLLEDIDCAFPSREDEEEDDDRPTDDPVYPMGYTPQSTVTLSGLLNVLDGVTSEEGRITFATTNHIERLDPALIRPGRMDLKLEYTLATRYQIHETYLRFFKYRFTSPNEPSNHTAPPPRPSPSNSTAKPLHLIENAEASLSENEILVLAQKFTEIIPEDTFSLAQIQGYLLTKKMEPQGAVNGAAEWTERQFEDRRKLEELKEEKKRKRRERKVNGERPVKRSHGVDMPIFRHPGTIPYMPPPELPPTFPSYDQWP